MIYFDGDIYEIEASEVARPWHEQQKEQISETDLPF